MSVIDNVSRRHFLGGLFSTGAFVLVARVLPDEVFAQGPAVRPLLSHVERTAFHPGIYLGIEPDGSVFIVTHRSEMGTGIRTALPRIAADELEADWSRVTVEQGIGDARYGDQNTDGSKSIRDFYDVFRLAGATARTMLVSAAAAQWGVPASECVARVHEVVHQPSGRTLGYGALAGAAATLPVPPVAQVQFKPKSAWRYIGKDFPAHDLEAIVTGTAVFGMDAALDGMVYASIEHPPVLGATVQSIDDAQALKVAGVRQIATIDPYKPPLQFQPLGGVAVIGDNTWAVLQGRRRLTVNWNPGPNAAFESDGFRKQLIATVQQPQKVIRSVGDVDAEFAKGGKALEATYYTPLLAHASMEPPVAVADVRDGRATIWSSVQNPQATQDTVAAALGIDKDNVIVHVTLLGGGFGRKSKPDFAAEAAVLSQKVGKPVKVVWSREDDIRSDFYHSTAAVYHKATVDNRGRPTAWLARSAWPPIASTFEHGAQYGLDLEQAMGLNDLPYELANHRVENGPASAHVRIGWFRAVANNYHVFASGSFADELAHAAGRDPLEYLLELIGPARIVDLKPQLGGADYWNYGAPHDKYPIDTGRLRRVLEIAGERSGWGKRKAGNGWGMGIAAHRSFNTYVASVVEVEVDKTGRVRVPKVVQVFDAGLVVSPAAAKAQFEGAAVMGVGVAMLGEITAAAGRIQQGNFNNFRVPRMSEAPVQVDVHQVPSDAPPSGVGEPGVPPMIPATANAVFAATGKRVRELPISKTKLV